MAEGRIDGCMMVEDERHRLKRKAVATKPIYTIPDQI
jgi:hypothetical protein